MYAEYVLALQGPGHRKATTLTEIQRSRFFKMPLSAQELDELSWTAVELALLSGKSSQDEE